MATNFVDGTTPLDAIALNGIENEIAEISGRIDDLESALGSTVITYFNFSSTSRTFEFSSSNRVAVFVGALFVLGATIYGSSDTMMVRELANAGNVSYTISGLSITITCTTDCRGFLLTR